MKLRTGLFQARPSISAGSAASRGQGRQGLPGRGLLPATPACNSSFPAPPSQEFHPQEDSGMRWKEKPQLTSGTGWKAVGDAGDVGEDQWEPTRKQVMVQDGWGAGGGGHRQSHPPGLIVG